MFPLRTHFILHVALIVYRIRRIRSNLGKGQLFIANSPLTNLLVVLIESGVIYTFSIIILCGVYVASNNAGYGVSNAVCRLTPPSFDTSWLFWDKVVQIIVHCHSSCLVALTYWPSLTGNYLQSSNHKSSQEFRNWTKHPHAEPTIARPCP